jgi:hypothetical protein
MKRIVYVVVIALCFMLPIHAQEEDNPDCKDHPLFTRMPGSYITSCDEKDFYAYTFTVGDGKHWDGTVNGTVYGADAQPITSYVFNGTAQNYGTLNGNATFNTGTKNRTSGVSKGYCILRVK